MLQKTPGLVDESTHLQEKLCKLRKNKDQWTLKTEAKITPGEKVSDLKTKTGSVVGSLQEMKSSALGADRI